MATSLSAAYRFVCICLPRTVLNCEFHPCTNRSRNVPLLRFGRDRSNDSSISGITGLFCDGLVRCAGQHGALVHESTLPGSSRAAPAPILQAAQSPVGVLSNTSRSPPRHRGWRAKGIHSPSLRPTEIPTGPLEVKTAPGWRAAAIDKHGRARTTARVRGRSSRILRPQRGSFREGGRT